jgi:hypothetical protein
MAEAERCGRCESVIPQGAAGAVQVSRPDCTGRRAAAQPCRPGAPGHPLSKRAGALLAAPKLAALEAIARRSTQVFTAETVPWQRLRRHQVLKIRSLLEENYLPATANRMLSALRGVLKEHWHSGRVGMEEYRLAVDVEPVRGESEPGGRDLSAAELRSLLEACARAPLENASARSRPPIGSRRPSSPRSPTSSRVR